nr:hypothetical protein [Halosolutus gelatinilyticus]
MTHRSMFVRTIWFDLVGWWLTPIVVNTAWALTVTAVLAPIRIN